jgi:hypothetical protein
MSLLVVCCATVLGLFWLQPVPLLCYLVLLMQPLCEPAFAVLNSADKCRVQSYFYSFHWRYSAFTLCGACHQEGGVAYV